MDEFLKGVIGYSLGLLSTVPALLWGLIYGSLSILQDTNQSETIKLLEAIPPEIFVFMIAFGFLISAISLIKYWLLSSKEPNS